MATDQDRNVPQTVPGSVTLGTGNDGGNAGTTTKEPQPQLIAIVPAPAQKPAPDTKPGETVDGGRYMVNGTVVDANGQPLKDKKDKE